MYGVSYEKIGFFVSFQIPHADHYDRFYWVNDANHSPRNNRPKRKPYISFISLKEQCFNFCFDFKSLLCDTL